MKHKISDDLHSDLKKMLKAEEIQMLIIESIIFAATLLKPPPGAGEVAGA